MYLNGTYKPQNCVLSEIHFKHNTSICVLIPRKGLGESLPLGKGKPDSLMNLTGRWVRDDASPDPHLLFCEKKTDLE